MTDSAYWKIVDEIWRQISIYDGADVFLSQFGQASPRQQALFASHWAQSEITNGGLGQLFWSPAGVLVPEAVAAFTSLKMPKTADLLKEAMTFFVEPYPRDRGIRAKALEAYWKKHGEDKIPMLELSIAIADLLEEENGGFYSAANVFASEGV